MRLKLSNTSYYVFVTIIAWSVFIYVTFIQKRHSLQSPITTM